MTQEINALKARLTELLAGYEHFQYLKNYDRPIDGAYSVQGQGMLLHEIVAEIKSGKAQLIAAMKGAK